MSSFKLRFFCFITILLATILSTIAGPRAYADAQKYPEAGTVSATSSKGGHVYVVATEKRIYQLLCARFAFFGAPECKLDGKPIAAGDTLHFRLEGDFAYIPGPADGTEEKFRVLMTTLKETPKPVPAEAAQGEQNAKGAKERGVVIGTGVHVKGAKGSYLSAPAGGAPGAAPAPGSMGPVVGVPVTGGAPVTVVPVAPAGGSAPVVGVPVTGGPPVTVVPVAPVGGGGMPGAGGAAGASGMRVGGGGGAPTWLHLLLVQTATHAYELECSTKPCALGGKAIEPGDNVEFQIEKNWAVFVDDPTNPKYSERFKILKVEIIGTGNEAKPAEEKK